MSAVRRVGVVISFALAFIASAAGAQSGNTGFSQGYDPSTPGRRGQAGMTFLQIGGSARAEGMGGAFAAVRGDPSAIFYNPAGVADVRGTAVHANHTQWVADMAINHFVVALNIRNITFGGTFVSMDYGQMQGTRIADSPTGYEKTDMVSPTAWASGLFAAVRLTDRFSAGTHIKYVVQDFGSSQIYSWSRGRVYVDEYRDNRVAAFALDLGTQYETGLRNLTINMAFQHFSGTVRYVEGRFDFPLTYRVGLGTEALELVTGIPNPTNKLMISVDGVDQRDVNLDAAVGLEYRGDLSAFAPGLTVALRAGRRAARNQDGWWSAGAGLGVPLPGFQLLLDYSYCDYGPHLGVHQFGLGLNLH